LHLVVKRSNEDFAKLGVTHVVNKGVGIWVCLQGSTIFAIFNKNNEILSILRFKFGINSDETLIVHLFMGLQHGWQNHFEIVEAMFELYTNSAGALF